jgi:hypothetical protein
MLAKMLNRSSTFIIMIKIQKLDCSSSGIDFCIFPVVKIHTVGVSVTHTPLPWYFDLPDSLKVTALLLVKFSEMPDTRLSVTRTSLTSC